MSTKNLAISIIIVLVIIAGGIFAFMSYEHTVLAPTSPTEVSQQNSPMTVQVKTITDNTKPFKIAITYPYIEGQDDFNLNMEAAINQELSDFKKNSLANDAAVKANDPADYAKYPSEYDLTISYDKGEVDSDIISIMVNVYNFEGGAHGASYFVPVNYNVKTKKEIALADLFPGQPDYVQKISNYCVQDLTKQLTKSLGNLNGTWIKDGAGPKEENFQAFLIQKDTIVFYFPQYQVAFYAAGSFQVVMPR